MCVSVFLFTSRDDLFFFLRSLGLFEGRDFLIVGLFARRFADMGSRRTEVTVRQPLVPSFGFFFGQIGLGIYLAVFLFLRILVSLFTPPAPSASMSS